MPRETGTVSIGDQDSDITAAPVARILAIDDDVSLAETIQLLLKVSGYEVVLALRGQEAWQLFNNDDFDLVLTDLRLPDTDGTELARSMAEVAPSVPIIMMTAYPSLASAVSALRNGAMDYVIKPFNNDDFCRSIERAVNKRRIIKQNAVLKRNLKQAHADSSLLGESDGIRCVQRIIEKVGPYEANVLIQGESGTGKDLVAQEIHYASPRASGPFVPIDCGAIPSNLIESELFGHVKGAYTGAVTTTEGLIREANGGTLFLDEIDTLDVDLQVKLLRVLQERQVRPLGGKRYYAVDARFVAASNQDLKKGLENGSFREDLYYRLNVINIRVPPLRERDADVEILARHYIDKYSRQAGREIAGMREDMKKFLYRYHWPGNVRELQNLIERAVLLTDDDHLSLQSMSDIGPESATGADVAEDALARKLSLEDYAQEFVRRYQDQYNETELASMLGIGRKALWIRRNRWGLHRDNASRRRQQQQSA